MHILEEILRFYQKNRFKSNLKEQGMIFRFILIYLQKILTEAFQIRFIS